jgi:hypothetical protein
MVNVRAARVSVPGLPCAVQVLEGKRSSKARAQPCAGGRTRTEGRLSEAGNGSHAGTIHEECCWGRVVPSPPSAFRGVIYAKAPPCRVDVPVRLFHPAEARPQHRHHGHRAHGWCGSYLSKYLGKPERRLALARSWASEGMNAGGPGIGVVVVWPHHVGIITGQTPDGQWIVHSGNDGGAVRTRARSLARAIAFRRV